MGLMAIVNIISIIGLSNVAFALMKDYQKQKKEGKNPVFKPENLEINLFGSFIGALTNIRTLINKYF